jgi:hypothetical protein
MEQPTRPKRQLSGPILHHAHKAKHVEGIQSIPAVEEGEKQDEDENVLSRTESYMRVVNKPGMSVLASVLGTRKTPPSPLSPPFTSPPGAGVAAAQLPPTASSPQELSGRRRQRKGSVITSPPPPSSTVGGGESSAEELVLEHHQLTERVHRIIAGGKVRDDRHHHQEDDALIVSALEVLCNASEKLPPFATDAFTPTEVNVMRTWLPAHAADMALLRGAHSQTTKHRADGGGGAGADADAGGCCQKKKTGPATPPPPTSSVSWRQLFQFADSYDILLMVVGGLCAVIHGGAMPATIVTFGDIFDAFGTELTTYDCSNSSDVGYDSSSISNSNNVGADGGGGVLSPGEMFFGSSTGSGSGGWGSGGWGSGRLGMVNCTGRLTSADNEGAGLDGTVLGFVVISLCSRSVVWIYARCCWGLKPNLTGDLSTSSLERL